MELVLIAILISYVFNLEHCLDKDVDVKVSQCDSNNQRLIDFYSVNNFKCIVDQYKNELNFNHTLTKEKSNCEYTCNDSEILKFNYTTGDFSCKRCKDNEYSLGQNYRLCGKSKEYYPSLFNKLFKTDCLSLDELITDETKILQKFNEYKDNINKKECSNFSTTIENHALVSGRLNNETSLKSRRFYYGKLDFELFYEREGTFLIGYLKRSFINKNDNVSNAPNNGIFYFFIDDNLVYTDDFSNNAFIMDTFRVTKGSYKFTWIYSYYNENESEGLRLEQRLLEGSNNNYACYNCYKCKRGFLKKINEGKPKCDYCLENTYLNEELNSCISCSEDYYSYRGSEFNSNNNTPCKLRPECKLSDIKMTYDKRGNNYDNYSIDFQIPKICQDKREVYNSISSLIFNNTSSSNLNNEELQEINGFKDKKGCFEGYSLNNITGKCEERENQCASDEEETKYISFASNTLIYESDFDLNECVGIPGGLCHYWNAWGFSYNKIYSRENNPENVWFVLTKSFNISSLNNSHLSYQFTINSKNDNKESFQIRLNGRNIESHNETTLKNNTIAFNNTGIYQLQFIYNRTDSLNSEIFATITDIEIVGVDKGIKKCIKKIIIPEKQYSITKVSTCPLYSKWVLSESRCLINDFIINRSYNLIFNLRSVQSFLQKECFYRHTDSSILNRKGINYHNEECIGRLIGPIRDHNKNLFYMNIIEPIKKDKLDSSLKIEPNDKGFFFLVETSNRQESTIVVNNTSKLSTTNKREIVNIAKNLNLIKILPYIDDSSYLNKYGIYLEYGDGDKCKEDNTKTYSTILIIYCDKSSLMTQPDFIGYKDCVFYFILYTETICPNCLYSDIVKFNTECNNGNRVVYIKESPMCIINKDLKLKFDENELDKKYILDEKESVITLDNLKDYVKLTTFFDNFNNINDSYVDFNNKYSDLSNVYRKLNITDFKSNYTSFDKNQLVFEDMQNDGCNRFLEMPLIFKVLIVVGPLVYLNILIAVIYFCYRLRNVSNDYASISNEVEMSSVVEEQNNQ